MQTPLETLQQQAWQDMATARKHLTKNPDWQELPNGASVIHPAHRLYQMAFDRWMKIEKLIKADKNHVPSEDELAQYA